MWGATHPFTNFIRNSAISTHTPHVGCDMQMLNFTMTMKISTHTPHVGCDAVKRNSKGFCSHISTHTPHVGCDQGLRAVVHSLVHFNSHTPCGVRLITPFLTDIFFRFQLTHPMWGATLVSFSFLVKI